MWCRYHTADESTENGTSDIWTNRLETYNRDIKILIPKPMALLTVIPHIAGLLKKGTAEAPRADAGLDKKKPKTRGGVSYTAVHQTEKRNCASSLSLSRSLRAHAHARVHVCVCVCCI